MNVALDTLAAEGFIPLSDAVVHADLLSTKYRRAVEALPNEKLEFQLTDLSFAIFDELVAADRLQKMSIKDVIAYRKDSESAREAFLEHLGALQAKSGAVSDDYTGDISRVIKAEIIPAARAFRNKIAALDGALCKSLIGQGAVALLGDSVLRMFPHLSWLHIIRLSGAFAATVLADQFISTKDARRECAVSYVLSLN